MTWLLNFVRVLSLVLLVFPAAASAEPLMITTTSVQPADCGVAYVTSFAAQGGGANCTWTIIGRLPRDLKFENQQLLGVPIEGGYFPFIVRVEDGEGNFDEAPFLIQVRDVRFPPYCPEGSGGNGGSSPEGGSGGTTGSGSPGGGGDGGGAAGSTAGGGGGAMGGIVADGGTGGGSSRRVSRAPRGCDCDAGSGPGGIALVAIALRRRVKSRPH